MDSVGVIAARRLQSALQTMRAAQQVPKLVAAQIYQERAGGPTGGEGAQLIGTGEVIAP